MSLDASLRHPLAWPIAQKRTPAHARKAARFNGRVNACTIASQLRELERELYLLGVPNVDWLVSSNLRMRQDGLPYSQQGRIEDPGIAVYFRLDGKPHCLACDRWSFPEHNLRAIVLHIAALRGQDRWGVGTLEQAFAGYAALPPAAGARPKRDWCAVLGVERHAKTDAASVKARYRALVKQHHPDAGGDVEAFKEVQTAWEEFCADLERAGFAAP